MVRLVVVLICTSFVGNSQEIKKVKISELEYMVPKDSTSLVVLTKNEPLKGKYRIVNDTFPTQFSITEFVDGKAEGKSEYYVNGKVIRIKEMKNGLPNGLSVLYDSTGKTLIWKIQMVNGVKHGRAWFKDEEDEYYVMGNKVTKSEFEKYEQNHKRN